MKNLVYLVALMLPTLLQAQSYIKIEDAEYTGFTSEAIPVFKVEIENVLRKDLMDNWEEYLNKQSDNKALRNDNDISIESALLKAVSSSFFDVYMHFEEMQDGMRMYVAFKDFEKGFIGSTEPNYGVALTKLVKERCNVVYVDAKKDYLKDEEKKLKDLEKIMAGYIKEEDKINKKILSKNREIEKIKSDIAINKNVLEEVRDEVATQRSNLNAMSAKTADEIRKSVEKELKRQEKKSDKLVKHIDKASRDVYDIESEVRDLNFEREKVKQDEKFAQERVMEQRELIMQIKNQVFQLQR